MAFAQSGAKWATGGNSIGTGDRFGSTNPFAILFITNNIQRMSLSTTGILQLNSLSGIGTGFVSLDANGNLVRSNFPNDPNKFLNGNGTFSTVSNAGAWSYNGNNIFNPNSGFVGIGTNSPQFLLDVNGNARVNGTLYALGLVLATRMEADTMATTNITATSTASSIVAVGTGGLKSLGMITLNNNLNFSGGTTNEIYTVNGDIRMQSTPGFNGNTILNAGTNGNVGIGTAAPQYKFDVNGDARVSGKMHVYRLFGANGDSIIRFGDSTMNFDYNHGVIYNSNTVGWKGMGIGIGALSNALYSTAIGHRVISGIAAINSITLGSGVDNGPNFLNNIPSSLAVGFNSTIPTFFVGPASGAGTYGKVGIGTTTPQYTLDINGSINATQILENGIPIGQWTSDANNNIYYNNPNGGSVGIGVAGTASFSPCATCVGNKFLLAVDGGIRAKALKVEPLWSDYVFDSTYYLMPLDTVADFITANHHLPNVQSAADVKTNGIDVGETEASLLAKIEELYLYSIQLQKQNTVLEKRIEVLEKKK